MPDNSWYDTSDVFSVPYDDVSQYSSPPDWFTPINQALSFDPSVFESLGFTGDIFNTGEMGNYLTPEFNSWMNDGGFKIKPTWEQTTLSDKEGNPLNTVQANWEDSLFGTLVNMGVGAVTGGALGGGGFAGSLGVSNPALAGAINSGLAGGMVAGGSDGNILQGMLQGAIGGGLGGTMSQINPAGSLGIENKTLASMFNKGVGNTIGTLASTQDPRAAITSGLSGAATTGLNAMGGNFFKSLFGGSQEGDTNFMGPPSWAGGSDLNGPPTWAGGNEFSGPPQLMMGPPADLAPSFMGPPADLVNNVMGNQFFPGTSTDSGPDKSISSLSSGLSNFGGNLGNFALNNAGDLVTMLYGMYNNRKQRGALQNQINGLQGLYGQNSPYAQQLRGKLQAQAAAKGTRLNTAGRETQLQAELANRAASLAPSLYQMQQGANTLQNTNIGNALNMFNKMGGWKALSDLFKG